MFNKTQRSIARNSLIAFAILLTIFVGNKLWQEYKLDVIIDIDTGAGGAIAANISWQDNSFNEDGFVVERKGSGDFVVMARLNSNETAYTDSNLVAGTAYCYRVGAFNQAGTAYSQEYCIDTPEGDSVTLPQLTGSATITSQFTNRKRLKSIDLAGRELYSFKSDATYNYDFTEDYVENVEYTIEKGKLSYRDSALFTFQDRGSDIDNGFVVMRYREPNNVSFLLNGHGDSQVASLYMSAIVRSSEPAEFLITAGDTSELISIPSGYTWHYLKIDIAFEESVAVKISPIGNFRGALRIGGVVLNETSIPSSDPPTDTSVPSVASLTNISLSDSENIDVSNVKYMTSDLISGNENLSNGEVIEIDYQGMVQYGGQTYSFIDNGAVVATGYTGMGWNEDNVISIDLENNSEQLVSGSLFLRAGAWTDGQAQLQINLNGETYPIELSNGYAWFYIRVDFEFSGDAHVEIKPVGNIGGYSQIAFAGLTMQ